MKISYYPGCTLKTKAKDLDQTARLCAKALGVEMEEIENYKKGINSTQCENEEITVIVISQEFVLTILYIFYGCVCELPTSSNHCYFDCIQSFKL